MPLRCSCSYSPENGRSVAFSRSTAYCIGDNSLRHSASLLTTLSVVLVSDMESPRISRHCEERSDEAIQQYCDTLDCFASLAMTKSSGSVGDLGVAHQCGLLDVTIRKDLLQVLDLRDVVEGNIGLVRVQRQVVLVIVLRRIERLQRADLGHDRLLVDLGGVELGDIGLRHLLLLVIGGEDRRAILRAGVGALAVQLGRVVHDREKDLQDLAIADL